MASKALVKSNKEAALELAANGYIQAGVTTVERALANMPTGQQKQFAALSVEIAAVESMIVKTKQDLTVAQRKLEESELFKAIKKLKKVLKGLEDHVRELAWQTNGMIRANQEEG